MGGKLRMNKDCENYGSSWCADFGDNCAECPVFHLKDKETELPARDESRNNTVKQTPKDIRNNIKGGKLTW